MIRGHENSFAFGSGRTEKGTSLKGASRDLDLRRIVRGIRGIRPEEWGRGIKKAGTGAELLKNYFPPRRPRCRFPADFPGFPFPFSFPFPGGSGSVIGWDEFDVALTVNR